MSNSLSAPGDRLTSLSGWRFRHRRPANWSKTGSMRRPLLFSMPQLVKREINYRRRVKREYLRNDQAADDSDAEWLAQFAANSHANSKG